jgi:hypothetical protein
MVRHFYAMREIFRFLTPTSAHPAQRWHGAWHKQQVEQAQLLPRRRLLQADK